MPKSIPYHMPRVGDIALPDGSRGAQLAAIHPQAKLALSAQNPDRVNNRVVYRGDSRHWSTIFEAGFAKQTYHGAMPGTWSELKIKGEKVLNGISTSTDLSTVRRKYGGSGFFVYGIYLRTHGVDFSDINDLYEVNTFSIQAQDVVAAAGPVRAQFDAFSVVGDVVVNARHTVPDPIAAHIVAALRSDFYVESALIDPF